LYFGDLLLQNYSDVDNPFRKIYLHQFFQNLCKDLRLHVLGKEYGPVTILEEQQEHSLKEFVKHSDDIRDNNGMFLC
jgi:hypothetical protein